MPPRKRFFGGRELRDEESTTSSVQNLGQEDEFVAQTPDENTLFEPIVFPEFTNPQQHPPLIQSPETHVSNRVLENQYWWFEYARTLNPIQDSLYNADEIPRIKAWGKDRIEKHYGMVRHNIDLSRQQIEMATTNKIVWTPWSTACIMVRDRDSFSEDGVDPTDDVWTARMVGSDGELVNYVIPHIDDSVLPQLDPHIEEHDVDTLRSMYALSLRLTHGMRRVLLDTSRQSFEDLEAERTRAAIAEHELEGIRLTLWSSVGDG
ncbi:hypothetical protein IFM89_034088 [Coptis chinensis]|uniref:Uncharacterized protein n=1 Tax=Coptis chinensis TaxID=261450 RepID=A0A835LCG7_9MAGN|nr:hypothetical protein IFM89_034088 [Coptis chinensis]